VPQQEHPQRGLAEEDDGGGALGLGGSALLTEAGESTSGRRRVDRSEVPFPEALDGHAITLTQDRAIPARNGRNDDGPAEAGPSWSDDYPMNWIGR
jgi:hypothetical protein